MRTYLTAYILVLCTALLASCSSSTKESTAEVNDGFIVKVGDMAPDFTITSIDGKEYSLSALKGKVVMLQFTASWCRVCREEMPHIESEIWQKHKDNPNFVLLAIDRDEPIEKATHMVETIGITYPVALDPGAEIFSKYALPEAGVTRNVLIDASGKIIYLTRLYDPAVFADFVHFIDSKVN